MGPLSGLKVIDMTSVVMGPYTTQLLGDYGADIIKVEAPGGDVVRQVGPSRHPGMGPLFLNSNRSKRSITMDLKTEAGRDALLRLAETADILIYNVRPAAMDRLGLSYDTLSQRNPRLIYTGVFGYGQNGPYAAKPAYDDLIQGATLVPYLTRRAGADQPHYMPSALSDRVVALFALSATLAAVIERQASGLGQRVDVPMFECMTNFILADHLGGLTFEPPMDGGGYARQLSPDRRPYQTQDGFVCTLIYTDAHWQRFFAAIGEEDGLARDERFASFPARMAHIDQVYGELSRILMTRSTAEWMAIFDAADVPAMPMYDFDDILTDPHLVATDYFALRDHPTEGLIREMDVPTRFYRSPATPSRPAPVQGEHGAEILREAGLSDAEISQLAEAGAWIAPAPAPAP
ncbi:MAG: CoA transferase [Paracoccus denitrificans]|nr:MAG: CoA transferase [Paracoccus denitrificans]PZO84280.1 MAG: CoA transferase [Paracoccus denitrificans]